MTEDTQQFWSDPTSARAMPRLHPPSTLAELATRQLASLAVACDLDDQLPQIVRTFLTLLGDAVGDRPTGAPAHLSDVVDDHTPYEMSIAVGGAGPELRVLVEPTRADRSLAARWSTARALGRYLRDAHGASLERFDRVAELFAPTSANGSSDSMLALWYAAQFRKTTRPEFKVYVDLRARGAAQAPALLEEALARLDLGAAYPRFLREAGARGRLLDELVYFSLDLVPGPRSRVKVYLRHHAATADDLARVLGALGGVADGEIVDFCTHVLGGPGPYVSRPIVSCWSFSPATSSAPSAPGGGTLYLPIAYATRDDDEARGKIDTWLERVGLPRDAYDRAVRAFARRPLHQGTGLHSYVSFKRERGAPKLTAYLAPEAYRVFEPGSLAARRFPIPQGPTTPETIVHHYETTERIADHPLFRRLAREAPAPAPLWTILANNWLGISEHFPSWLGDLAMRTEGPLHALLAKQLAELQGGGDPAKAHRTLFQQLLEDLAPYAPEGDRDALLAPGKKLAQALSSHYLLRPAIEAVGGTLIMQAFGDQVEQRLGELLRRETGVDTHAVDALLPEPEAAPAASAALELAHILPADAASREAACRGAEEVARLGQAYLDELYEVIFR